MLNRARNRRKRWGYFLKRRGHGIKERLGRLGRLVSLNLQQELVRGLHRAHHVLEVPGRILNALHSVTAAGDQRALE